MTAAPQSEMQKVIAALWQRNRPQVLARLDALDRAAMAAATGSLTPELRDEALSAAHTLAGSLGMYGFPQGTNFARALEQQLEAAPHEPVELLELTGSLRQSLFPSEHSAN